MSKVVQTMNIFIKYIANLFFLSILVVAPLAQSKDECLAFYISGKGTIAKDLDLKARVKSYKKS